MTSPGGPALDAEIVYRQKRVRTGFAAGQSERAAEAVRRAPEVCSWCQAVIRSGNPALQVSHGICEPCREEHFPDFPEEELASAEREDDDE